MGRHADAEGAVTVDRDARIVTLMGSGELAPTMVKVHRSILERLGSPPVRSVFLDTPFGFQENAVELGQRAITYFDESLHTPLQVAGEDDARLTSLLRDARYAFSGPGSPTYALRHWHGTAVPQLLIEKLTLGGAVTFASAAALTLGAFTVPVYEIYKVGEDPHWLEGMDVLGSVGLRVAVVPHYNNAEGGTHDTRFCYLGERRLSAMEEQLPEDTFVLGVDEHTAIVIDLERQRATVDGLGVVTVRRAGRSVVYGSGTTISLGELHASAFDGRRAPPIARSPATEGGAIAAGSPSPLFDIIRAREAAFARAISERDAPAATETALGLEDDLHEWSTDIPGQDELTRARAALRSMVSELGELAVAGVRDPREVVGDFVELILELRREARDDRRYDVADRLREALEALGIELRDSPGSTDWVLAAAPFRAGASESTG